jgi:hypothetical protein
MSKKINRHLRPIINYYYGVSRADYRMSTDYGRGNNFLEYSGDMPIRRKRESPLSLMGEELLRRAPILVAVMSLGLSDLNELRSYLRRP